MKHLKLLICMMVLAFALTACSKGEKDITVDVAKLAEELQAQTVTSDTLSATAPEMIPSIFYLEADQVTKGVAYMSSGSTSCEVAVIECSEAKQAEEVAKSFQTRVTNQSDLFASYDPEEVTKLDAAIIKTSGKYAVLCVCDDTKKAEEILKNYGF